MRNLTWKVAIFFSANPDTYYGVCLCVPVCQEHVEEICLGKNYDMGMVHW